MPASFFNSMNTLHQNKGSLIRINTIQLSRKFKSTTFGFVNNRVTQYAKSRDFVKTLVVRLPAMLDFISAGGYSYLTKSSLEIAFP
jgi:hypothetical protein